MKATTATPDPQRIRRRLTRWYDEHRRLLPWRETDDPYAIWVSEIMLQQTRVDTVIPYYGKFLARFPTVESLSRAPFAEVLKLWENLGYYARVRNLHKAAGEIVARFKGRMPERMEEISRLSGIGRYTAGAILSIAFGRAVPAVDGNVRRVISRLWAIEEPIDDEKVRERIEGLAGALVPTRDPGRFNQALMELGAVCCTPRSPSCPACPVREECRACSQGSADRLPVRVKKKAVPHREVVAAVIGDGEGRLLLVQRPSRGLLGSLWKFPGGILEPPESREEGLERIVRAELGLRIAVGPALAAVNHAYTHFRITLTAFSCALRSGSPAGPAWQWADADEIEALPLSKADRRIARLVVPGPLPELAPMRGGSNTAGGRVPEAPEKLLKSGGREGTTMIDLPVGRDYTSDQKTGLIER